jgi:GTP-binding protein
MLTDTPNGRLQIISAEFIKSAAKPDQYPDHNLPEIAFAGRSNVGKSTLINGLLSRRRLVKTSKTPGRTQLINFFLVNQALFLVDLPGYGYAKVPKPLRDSWGPFIETYLLNRAQLRGVVLILDIRRTPGYAELNFVDWLQQHAIPGILVLTKTDKLSKNRRINQRRIIAKRFARNSEDFILFSGKTGAGKSLVWSSIESVIAKGNM